jgi:hypothetical protein
MPPLDKPAGREERILPIAQRRLFGSGPSSAAGVLRTVTGGAHRWLTIPVLGLLALSLDEKYCFRGAANKEGTSEAGQRAVGLRAVTTPQPPANGREGAGLNEEALKEGDQINGRC